MLVLLAGRAAVFIELGSYAHAQKDAEKVIGMDQENTQVKLCLVFITFKHFKLAGVAAFIATA